MTHTIFIDGSAGTTGLRIAERLRHEHDIHLLTLPEAQRKDLGARLDAAAASEVSLLCLPDEAAREFVQHAPAATRICDTSTAHRNASGWVYGFAELHGQRAAIKDATRVANPGCHASGFIALIRPLCDAGALRREALLTCQSLTGYSGGGKAMIAEYEAESRPAALDAPRLYGLSLQHKHLPEMRAQSTLAQAPLFTPVVAPFYSGMLVSVPLFAAQLADGFADGKRLAELLADYYADEPLVRVQPFAPSASVATLAANALAGRDDMQLFVFANGEGQLLLCALFDNLGKGASGAAVQNLNLMLGRAETAGLVY